MNIDRTIHDVQQGTGPWLRLREGRLTASEAPAALGVSRFMTRAELLRRKHTGVTPDPDAATLGRFAAGHAAEAKARPLAEEQVGGDLYPVTVTADVDGLPLLASLDGLTLDETIAWESKLWNEELAAAVRAGALPEQYLLQMDQALLVTGADRCLFTCTDGTPDRFVSCWHERDEARFAALLSGWRQFAADLAAYVLPDAAEPAPVGKAPETLPALLIEVTGAVTASNLAEFKSTALAAIRSVNRNLRTDQDFADAEKATKWCAEVESRLKAAKERALAQTSSIEALFRAIDEISAEARTVRLDLDKLVTRRKTEVKEEAVAAARRALDAHIATLNAEIAPMRVPQPLADFAGAIKGLKSFASMQDKLDAALTVAKIAAEADARAIRANVAVFNEKTAGLEFLFADLAQLVHKPADDFATLVQARVDTHRAAEERRAREKAEAEERQRQAVEAQRLADEQRAREQAAQVVAQAAAVTPPVAQIVPPTAAPAFAVTTKTETVTHPTTNKPATLKLGTICDRLGFTVSAAFLADTLHVKPAKVDGRASLFTESQFRLICSQLMSHCGAMAELYAGEVAA